MKHKKKIKLDFKHKFIRRYYNTNLNKMDYLMNDLMEFNKNAEKILFPNGI